MTVSTDRFDLALVPAARSRAVAERAGGDFIRNLAALRMIRPVDESVAHDWVEVYCEPGEAAHDPFVLGVRPAETPIFEQAVIRFGTRPTALGYGEETDSLRFYLEFRGCLFEDVLGEFRARISRLLLIEPETDVRPASGSTEQRPVAPEEATAATEPADSGRVGLVGVRVEDL